MVQPHSMSATGSMILVLNLLAAALMMHPSAACLPEERNALLTFKAGIKADPLGLLSNWTANGDCCTWGGSFCDSTGHITEITFLNPNIVDDETYSLKGRISPALAKLTHLEVLNLSDLKQLSGSLPTSLGTLKNLQTFSVRTSKLTGSIPSSYGSLTNLTLLDLGYNTLSGPIPPALGNIGPQLQYLYLGHNDLSGAIPTSLYNLTGLDFFYLNDNRLTGGISKLIGRLRNLTDLDFANNNLTGAIPSDLGNLTALSSLKLNDNKLTGEIPTALAANLKELTVVDLSNNRLTGPIPQGAPFSTFPPSAFAGNAGLCGNPLPPCRR